MEEIIELKDEEQVEEVAISIADLVSCEHYKENDTLIPLLHGITFNVNKNDIYGISGNEVSQVLVLCEVLGSIRPYYKGYVRLTDLGTKRKKREIVEKLYYIDTHEMLYGNMTVLEQLLFATVKQSKGVSAIERQKNMLDLIVNNGLKTIALTKISELTPTQRLIVTLFVASLSTSDTIIMNLVNYEFSQDEIEMFSVVSHYVRSLKKTLVIATMQPKLIGMICDKVLFLYKGGVEYNGPIDMLCAKWDRVVCLIRSKTYDNIIKAIETKKKHYKCYVEEGILYVRNHSNEPNDQRSIIKALEDKGIIPDYIKFNTGRVENSFKELLVKYDI